MKLPPRLSSTQIAENRFDRDARSFDRRLAVTHQRIDGNSVAMQKCVSRAHEQSAFQS